MEYPPLKMVFFDMEGTLFKKAMKSTQDIAPSAWSLMAQELGPAMNEANENLKTRYNEGEFKYIEFMRKTINAYSEHGLTEDFFNEVVLEKIDYHFGVKETINELHDAGIVTALISGGFKAQAEKAQRELGIPHAMMGCEFFWDDEGHIAGYNLLPGDYIGKKVFFLSMIDEYGFSREECGFVGDGKNDIYIAKEAGVPVAFNAHSKLEEVIRNSPRGGIIRQPVGKEDFREVLKYFLPNSY